MAEDLLILIDSRTKAFATTVRNLNLDETNFNFKEIVRGYDADFDRFQKALVEKLNLDPRHKGLYTVEPYVEDALNGFKMKPDKDLAASIRSRISLGKTHKNSKHWSQDPQQSLFRGAV